MHTAATECRRLSFGQMCISLATLRFPATRTSRLRLGEKADRKCVMLRPDGIVAGAAPASCEAYDRVLRCCATAQTDSHIHLVG